MTDALPAPDFFDGPHGRLAYRSNPGKGPMVVWLGGLRSDMDGSKATALHDWAAREDRAYLRFDYSGHGLSDGVFEEGCVSQWAADAKAIIDAKTDGPLILVGSSMGGWVTCLLAPALKARLHAVVFIAPAPDFTEALLWKNMSEEQRKTLTEEGHLAKPSDYGEPMIFSKKLIEDGRKNQVLKDPIDITAPVRILQGAKDPDVPYAHAMRLIDAITSDDIDFTLVKDGDHPLSSPRDIDRLITTLDTLPD